MSRFGESRGVDGWPGREGKHRHAKVEVAWKVEETGQGEGERERENGGCASLVEMYK